MDTKDNLDPRLIYNSFEGVDIATTSKGNRELLEMFQDDDQGGWAEDLLYWASRTSVGVKTLIDQRMTTFPPDKRKKIAYVAWGVYRRNPILKLCCKLAVNLMLTQSKQDVLEFIAHTGDENILFFFGKKKEHFLDIMNSEFVSIENKVNIILTHPEMSKDNFKLVDDLIKGVSGKCLLQIYFTDPDSSLGKLIKEKILTQKEKKDA